RTRCTRVSSRATRSKGISAACSPIRRRAATVRSIPSRTASRSSAIRDVGGRVMTDMRSRLFLVLGLGLAAVTGLLLYGTLTAAAGSHEVARLDVVVTRAAVAANAPLTAALLDHR